MTRRKPLATLAAVLGALTVIVAAGCGGMVSSSGSGQQAGAGVANAGAPATPGAQRHIIYL